MSPDDVATILLVEDDLATRTFLADNLSADGYELLVADCVSDGLRLLERKFPDLALIDLGLPDGSGYELLRLVRSSDGVSSRLDPQTPLIVLSGRASELDRVRGFDRGADDYVTKPFSYPELRGVNFHLAGQADFHLDPSVSGRLGCRRRWPRRFASRTLAARVAGPRTLGLGGGEGHPRLGLRWLDDG